MSENQVYFFLHFVRGLGTPARELIIRGGESDPLEYMLTIAEVSNYDEAMEDPDFELEPRYDFILNDAGEIIHQLSNGLQLTAYFDYLEPPDKEQPEHLWKLKKEIPHEGMLMYPEEIQIIVQNAYEGQYLIKPQRELVRLETFKQMLRCLPWMKMFTFEEILRKKQSCP
ncbi:uncharacterized protein LOC114963777 [Acropora millepora]|uniref:uncharacterized protein LOC114963777 n=1 Tax=Acropora millepora TaxID=45264 RepID=UPI001CF20EC3|nr:uncharacterized protein LOC114963777 [Acropora millepora]XP_044174428.1 uncharacterized protein LOC114963777 [Acropora millepora]